MEGIGESFHVHLPHPSLAFLSFERECFPSYLTACCGFPAVVPLAGAVVPLALGAYPVLIERLYRCFRAMVPPTCLAKIRAVVPARHRPSTGQAPVLMRWLCGSQAVSPVIFLSRYYRPPFRLYRLVGFRSYTVSPGCTGTRTGCEECFS